MNYGTTYRLSLENPTGFWGNAAEEMVWSKRRERVQDETNAPFYEWFSGGEINTCYEDASALEGIATAFIPASAG